MSIVGLSIRLVDPVALTRKSASGARSETLSYLPGSALLGIAASKLYDTLENERAFTLFHSGALRFGDALLTTPEGALCLPAPMSLHHEKGKETKTAKDSTITDFAICSRAPGHKQIKDKEVALDGTERFQSPKRAATLRTAIAVTTGLAEEGQLYGYETLSADQVFWSRIEGDEADIEQVTHALEGTHYIGRSKTAEFGRAEIKRVKPWELAEPDAAQSGARFVWALSDLWLTDTFGLPTARPLAEVFAAKAIDWTHSFTRSREVVPFNAKWQRHGEARSLVQRGAVLKLENCTLTPGLHHVGLGQERGYGMIWVSQESPVTALGSRVFLPDVFVQNQNSQAESGQQSAFVDWLKERHSASRTRQDAGRAAEEDLEQLREHYASARRLAGAPVGPTASQWMGLATRLSAGADTSSHLGENGDRDSSLWGAVYGEGDPPRTFRSFVAQIECAEDGIERLQILAKLANRALEREGWLSDTFEPPASERGAQDD